MWLHTPNGAEVSSIYRVSFRLGLRKTQLVCLLDVYLFFVAYSVITRGEEAI